MKAPSQKQLDKWLKEWQNILRLQDWDIQNQAGQAARTCYEMGIEGESIRYQQTNKTGSDSASCTLMNTMPEWKPGTQKIERVSGS
jgi:hypothetical protein